MADNANTDPTTTNPTPDEEVTTPPEFAMPLEELLPSSIFNGDIVALRVWVGLYIGLILKFQEAIDQVLNLVNANNPALQARGERTVVRLIKAQACYLQAKDSFFRARGKKGFDTMVSLLDEMRRDDASDEEFENACTAFMDEYAAVKAELDQKAEIGQQILDLLSEPAFKTAILEGGKLKFEWQLELIHDVLEGNAHKGHVNGLNATLNAVQFQFDKFFGLNNFSANTGSSSGSGRSASKAKAKERGVQEYKERMEHPERKRGYVQEGGRKK